MSHAPQPLKPDAAEIQYALSIMTYIFDTLNIEYGFIGEQLLPLPLENMAFHNARQKTLISSFSLPMEYLLFLYLNASIRIPDSRTGSDQDSCMEHLNHVWPHRRNYYDLNLESNAKVAMTVENRSANFLNASWLLRQKIRSYPERSSPVKRQSDMQDVETLCQVLLGTGQNLRVTIPEEVAALQTVYAAANESLKDTLQQAVDCPQAFLSSTNSSVSAPSAAVSTSTQATGSTDWIWSEQYQKYYRYDDANQVVWD